LVLRPSSHKKHAVPRFPSASASSVIAGSSTSDVSSASVLPPSSHKKHAVPHFSSASASSAVAGTSTGDVSSALVLRPSSQIKGQCLDVLPLLPRQSSQGHVPVMSHQLWFSILAVIKQG
jgi:hypothetical protein